MTSLGRANLKNSWFSLTYNNAFHLNAKQPTLRVPHDEYVWYPPFITVKAKQPQDVVVDDRAL